MLVKRIVLLGNNIEMLDRNHPDEKKQFDNCKHRDGVNDCLMIHCQPRLISVNDCLRIHCQQGYCEPAAIFRLFKIKSGLSGKQWIQLQYYQNYQCKTDKKIQQKSRFSLSLQQLHSGST